MWLPGVKKTRRNFERSTLRPNLKHNKCIDATTTATATTTTTTNNNNNNNTIY